MKYLIALILLLPSMVFADAKRLTCLEEYVGGTGKQIKREWQAIFDTDDFSKENPEYEFTILRDSIDGKPTVKSLLGNKYRYKFKVTPSTLTFSFCLSERLIDNNCALSDGYSLMRAVNVSRENLSTNSGQCTIEDYGASNRI